MAKSGSLLRIAGGISALLLSFLFTDPIHAAPMRDGGIDPANLGRGEWIYILPNAMNQLGGRVPAVTNLSSLMIFLKNQGLNYVIIKAATGDTLYPSQGSPQFTSQVVNAGHAAGLKIFGYNRSDGLNIPGEVSVADYVFNQGADGFVFDAESEWESQNLANNTVLATQLCSTVRAHWPNKFLAHSPYPYITYHSTFPYKEFGYYCDAVMPQDYWNEIGPPTVTSPTDMVADMNSQYSNWQNGLTGKWTNSIKPIVPAGQGWNTTNYTTTAAQITEFVRVLKTIANPATAGGYKGVNFFRAELHTLEMWDAIRTNSIGNTPTNAPVVENVASGGVSDQNATINWTTDQSSDSVIEFGLTAAYGNSITNATALWYHTVTLPGLSPNTTYHYRAKSMNAASQTGVSGDYVFTTVNAPVPDIIIDNLSATIAGSWSSGNSSNDKYGSDYRYKSKGTGAAYAQFTPAIATAGSYDVYEWHPAGGNRASDAPHVIQHQGGSQTVFINQITGGGRWNLLGRFPFSSGTAGWIRISDAFTSGTNVMADAVKFVYVPPPPSPPSIATQPAPQIVNQGDTAAFTVVASGTPLLYYQWRFKGVDIQGATETSYQKNNVQTNDAGAYTVVVTNIVNSVTSITATLSVRVPPTILAQPADLTTNVGGTAVFSVVATGTAPLGYQWHFNGVAAEGATGTSYTRTNVQAADAGVYSVVVSNAAGSVPSADALLSIVQPQIESIQILPDQTVELNLSGVSGDFALEVSTNLSSWSTLTNIMNADPSFTFRDMETNQPVRFYRVRLLPQGGG